MGQKCQCPGAAGHGLELPPGPFAEDTKRDWRDRLENACRTSTPQRWMFQRLVHGFLFARVPYVPHCH